MSPLKNPSLSSITMALAFRISKSILIIIGAILISISVFIKYHSTTLVSDNVFARITDSYPRDFKMKHCVDSNSIYSKPYGGLFQVDYKFDVREGMACEDVLTLEAVNLAKEKSAEQLHRLDASTGSVTYRHPDGWQTYMTFEQAHLKSSPSYREITHVRIIN